MEVYKTYHGILDQVHSTESKPYSKLTEEDLLECFKRLQEYENKPKEKMWLVSKDQVDKMKEDNVNLADFNEVGEWLIDNNYLPQLIWT